MNELDCDTVSSQKELMRNRDTYVKEVRFFRKLQAPRLE